MQRSCNWTLLISIGLIGLLALASQRQTLRLHVEAARTSTPSPPPPHSQPTEVDHLILTETDIQSSQISTTIPVLHEIDHSDDISESHSIFERTPPVETVDEAEVKEDKVTVDGPDNDDSINDVPQICPPMVVTDPTQPIPPTNWTWLIPPVLKPNFNGTFYMIDVLHSLNLNFHYQHIICKYQPCALYSCPTLTILSNATFIHPSSPESWWGVYARINNTLICNPLDHDVTKCQFS